jgi:polar amino acid transport system substrate-binding protein
MKIPDSNARPPRWAESLLRLILNPKDRESVSGDLLEEYRDTIVPALGPAASRWYARKVGSFLLRASWGWGAFLGAALVIRYLLDTLVPPRDYLLRAAILSYTIIGASLFAGFFAAWRTRTIRAGVLISISAATIGALFSIVGTAVMLALRHDDATLDAWRNSGGLDEAFIDVPLKLVAIGAVMGFPGAVAGRFVGSLYALIRLTFTAAFSFVLVALTSSAMAQQISTPARSELAPAGKLRAGINFGNAVLATRDAKGAPHGIAVDLAQELASRAGVPLEIVSFDSAGRMADAVKSGAWDVAFLGADPDRAGEIEFTAPYLQIDSTYLVPANSSFRAIADVDAAGVRIAVSEKSAYDLALTRTLKRATLVRVPGVNASVDLFFAEKLDALASLRPLLVELAESRPGTRVLDGRFAVVEQALGAPKQRTRAAQYLREFIENVKATGIVAKALQKNNARGVTVAPPATAQQKD